MLCHQRVLGIALKVVHGFLWLWFLHRFLASPLNWGVNFYDHGCYSDYCVFHSFWTLCKFPLNGESEIESHPVIEKNNNQKSAFKQKVLHYLTIIFEFMVDIIYILQWEIIKKFVLLIVTVTKSQCISIVFFPQKRYEEVCVG